MSRLTIVTHAALAVTLLGLAACNKVPENQSSSGTAPEPASSTQAPATSAAPIADVCALLTDEEFQQATGFAVHRKKSWPGVAPGCDWELKSDPQGLHRLSVNVQSPGGRKRFDFVSQSLPGIANLGDAAAKTGGDINGTVWAVKGDTLVTANYSLPVKTSDPDPVVVPLVRLLLSRL